MSAGIYELPVMRGFLGMGLFFTVSSTVVMTKTMRDDHEGRKLIKRLSNAKTEKMQKIVHSRFLRLSPDLPSPGAAEAAAAPTTSRRWSILRPSGCGAAS